MKRFLIAAAAIMVGGFGMFALPATPATADITSTQVTISCNDGHSVVLSVDQLQLATLTSEIQAIDSGGAGLSCALATDPPSSETSEWTVYDYNPSGQEIAPRVSSNSLPATTTGGNTWQFLFKPNIYTALFT